MNNLKNMFTRLSNRGGQVQQDRMIKDKQRTLERAVKYSYQGAQIQLVNSEEIVPALMNPNKLLADYDEKTVSVEFDHGFKTGEVFRWINPSMKNGDTYWLIYLQDLTELAYFRADVRRCSYQISWIDANGEVKKTYIAIKGPREQKIQSISKSQFNMDLPNYTITILMPKNTETIDYFKRYAKFYLQGLVENDTPICWRVEAIDSISLPGVLEVHAREYYANDDEDDLENGIPGGLIEPIINKEQIEEENKEIVGDNFIKPKFTYEFEYMGKENAVWSYDNTLPIKADIVANKISITWTASYSGQFVLSYGSSNKTIVVESLF